MMGIIFCCLWIIPFFINAFFFISTVTTSWPLTQSHWFHMTENWLTLRFSAQNRWQILYCFCYALFNFNFLVRKAWKLTIIFLLKGGTTKRLPNTFQKFPATRYNASLVPQQYDQFPVLICKFSISVCVSVTSVLS